MAEHSEPDPDQPGTAEEPPQLVLMRRMLDLAVQRTELAAQRTEMSAERSYLNVERTLSVWVRTALAVMVVGIAVDRFGLFLRENSGARGVTSDLVGAGLVALGVLVAVVPSVRFARYSRAYLRTHSLPQHHGPFMAPAFAGLVALAGIVLLVLLLLPA